MLSSSFYSYLAESRKFHVSVLTWNFLDSNVHRSEWLRVHQKHTLCLSQHDEQRTHSWTGIVWIHRQTPRSDRTDWLPWRQSRYHLNKECYFPLLILEFHSNHRDLPTWIKYYPNRNKSPRQWCHCRSSHGLRRSLNRCNFWFRWHHCT